MKRYGNLYEKIISIDNCKEAILNASQGKRRRRIVKSVMANLDKSAEDLSRRIQELDFTTPFLPMEIKDGLSGKVRTIDRPKFYPDQCAHHAIFQIIAPLILKSSYYWSCANLRDRGISRARIGVERATKRDKKHAKYCVKMDIRKFYPTIPHSTIKTAIRRKIKDKKVIAILDTIIDSTKQGIPIGTYPSPWFAELVLQPVDMLIKEKYGIKHYIRYADDLVLIDGNKKKLRKAMYGVIGYIKSLGMEIKPNYQLFRVWREGRGRKIDFVGYCFGIGVTTIRKRRALVFMRQSRFIQKLQRRGNAISYHMAAGFISRGSCFNYTQSLGFKRKYYDTVNVRQLKEVIRNESKRQYCTRAS